MTRAREILEDLKQRKRSFDIDGEPHWIVEGDLVLNEFRLELYAEERAEAEAVHGGEKKRGLVAMTRDERIVRWRPAKILNYTVKRHAFASQETYEGAVRDMRLAATSWESVCGVQFKHEEAFDERADDAEAGTEGVVFRVRQLAGVGGLIASAFFPDWPAEERWVNLYDSYFDRALGFDPIGVLRHELGHVLGFRHEHIRIEAPMDCPEEDGADTRALTEYDPESVMHYFCGGMGSRTLEITELDRQGARDVYGPPLADFDFVD